MAAAALVLSLLDDKPVLILAPATLIWQWQDELDDKLGIPAAVWSTQKKCWLDTERRPLTQKGDATLVSKCPRRVGIVSIGLIINGNDEGERGALARKAFGVLILDEAHKARSSRGQSGREAARPNNLLGFLKIVARNAANVILGTATPIQMGAVELWDLLSALTQGAPQVLGMPFDGGEWMREESIQYLTMHDLGRPTTRTVGVCSATLCRLRTSIVYFATCAQTPASQHGKFWGRDTILSALASGRTSSRISRRSPSGAIRSYGALCAEHGRC